MRPFLFPFPVSPGRHFQSGSSLFEVLVSVLILGVGLLGMVAVQTKALRHATDSLEWAQAAWQGQALLEIMRSRRADALAGYYHTGGFVCAGTSPARADLRHWLEEVHTALGETACAEVACQGGAAHCRVTIRWSRVAGETEDGTPYELGIGTRL